MNQNNRRRLEVEILEDRCTPSFFSPVTPAQFNLPGPNNFSPNQFSSIQLLPNDTPASQVAFLVGQDSGVVLAPLFNFTGSSEQNVPGFPTPAASLFLVSGLPNGTLSTGIGGSAFLTEGLEGLVPGGLAELGSGVNAFGELAAAGLLLSGSAGVPSTVPFASPGYYEGLPMFDAAVSVPDSVEFESMSPFVANGMGRASYEGGDGEGMFTPPTDPPTALPPPAKVSLSMPYLILDGTPSEPQP